VTKETECRMTTSKDKVVTIIAKARDDLEQVLVDLEQLPVFDSGSIAFAAHALSNFLSVIRARWNCCCFP
jgi:hypothetical protein